MDASCGLGETRPGAAQPRPSPGRRAARNAKASGVLENCFRERRAQCKGQRRARAMASALQYRTSAHSLAARFAKASRQPGGGRRGRWRAQCKSQRRARCQGRRRSIGGQAALPRTGHGRQRVGRRRTVDGTSKDGCREGRAQCKSQRRTRRQWRRYANYRAPAQAIWQRNAKASSWVVGD